MLLFLSLKLSFTFLSVDFIPLIKVHFEIQKYGARVSKVVLITVSSPESNVKAKRQGFRTFFCLYCILIAFLLCTPVLLIPFVSKLGPTPSYIGQSSVGYFCRTPAF